MFTHSKHTKANANTLANERNTLKKNMMHKNLTRKKQQRNFKTTDVSFKLLEICEIFIHNRCAHIVNANRM